MERKIIENKIYIPLDKNIGDVMVLGAGVAGIQASLDLADSGFRVYLVDKAPAIGGHMAQFDKVFPTLDCSMCIESPKFIECERHPNIEILTYTEVGRLKGDAGNFKVSLIKKPRYIQVDKCRGCGACAQVCPVSVPDIYNQNLSSTKAAHIYFAQAVPLISYIDPDECLFLRDKKCNICLGVCEDKAIDFNQKEEELELEVGAIVLALGYEVFDPGPRADYGYGKIKNVITSLEFERILNADGPYRGEVVRLSDGKPPKKMAWIQCVGSRQVVPGGHSYCSAVCCMYAIKQVILVKERISQLKATIFHNDIRSYGKEFEQFYQRAKSLPGVQFKRSYVSIGREIPESKNVTIRYSLSGSVKEDEFDMIVLSVGLTPPDNMEKLAGILGIDLNPHGFCKTTDSTPLQTSRPGIFVAGALGGPKDIPESVMTGSAAAALSGQLLSARRGKLARDRVYPPERDISAEEPKVGVFVCYCGSNIASVVDVPSVVQYASHLKSVVYAEENLFSCSTDSARHISETIEEKGLNRVVVAACTPRTHEPLFQDTLREAGINKYTFVMANIREHSSWVHSREKNKATQKAMDKVRMAVARAVNQHPLKELELPVKIKGLIIGGGVAGMTVAMNLAEQGFEVCLLEKSKNLGGIAQRIHYSLEGLDVQNYLKNLVYHVYHNPLVHIITNSVIMGASGYVGNFGTTVMSDGKVKEIQHGVTIIANGAEEYKPTEYLYGKDDRVLTLLELEEKIAQGDKKVINAKCMVIILCVGSREKDRPYCSRTCCGQAIKCALRSKEINPRLDIYILYRDIRTYGFKEDYYREAAKQGVTFIHFDVEGKPLVEAVENNGKSSLRVAVNESVLDKKLVIDVDLIALAAAVVPSAENEKISHLFRASRSQDGFFLEAHMKLRPVDLATEGIFVCGMAHFPKTISETISQANAAAGRASTILSKGKVIASGAVCEVKEADCIGCGLCQQVCQYHAIDFHDTPDGKKFKVNTAICQGCGVCCSVCPTDAITLNHFTDQQIFSEIDSAFSTQRKERQFEPKIVGFLCNWCGYAGADMAGVSRMQFAPNMREIRVMCSSRIHTKFIAEAFLEGIDGVLICGCHLGDCHYMKANEQTEKMFNSTKKKLEKIGINSDRLRREYISASEGAKYAEAVNSFTNFLTKLGPIEINEEQEKKLTKLKLKTLKTRKRKINIEKR